MPPATVLDSVGSSRGRRILKPINDDKKKDAKEGANSGDVELSWEVGVEGEVTAHIIPTIAFGIVFDDKWALPSASIDLGLDAYSQLYGSAGATQSTGGARWCYGADAGYELFARVQAPRLFGVNLNRHWTLADGLVNVFGDRNSDETCGSA